MRTNWEPTYKTVSSCLKYCFNYQLEYEMKAISITLQRARPSRDSYEHVIKVAVPSTVSRILKKSNDLNSYLREKRKRQCIFFGLVKNVARSCGCPYVLWY